MKRETNTVAVLTMPSETIPSHDLLLPPGRPPRPAATYYLWVKARRREIRARYPGAKQREMEKHFRSGLRGASVAWWGEMKEHAFEGRDIPPGVWHSLSPNQQKALVVIAGSRTQYPTRPEKPKNKK